MDYELGRWLLAGERVGAHVVLGYGSCGEHVERLFGFDRRQVRERLRVAKALEELPSMAAALPAGELCWSVVRELSRVATPETEAQWIGAVARCTARDVERLVARHRRGALPTDKPSVEAPKRVTFEVSGATWALVEEAKKTLRARRERVGRRGDDGARAGSARWRRGARRGAGELSDRSESSASAARRRRSVPAAMTWSSMRPPSSGPSATRSTSVGSTSRRPAGPRRPFRRGRGAR